MRFILKLNKFWGGLILILILLLLGLSLDLKLNNFLELRYNFGLLMQDAAVSFARVFFVSVFAWITGIVTGYLLYRTKILEIIFLPSINFFRHISPFAWLPFAIIWFGLGESSVAFIMFITLFFPVIIASTDIFSGIPSEYIDEAKVSGANLRQIFRQIEIPLSIPALINLFRIIWALGWATIIAAEMLGVNSGLGFRLLDFRYLLKYPEMLIYISFMGIIGIVSDLVLNLLYKKTNRRILGL